MSKLTIYNVAAFFLILFVDFYFSIWGKIEDIGGINPIEISDKEVERAKAVSLVFASPAYIISLLTVINIVHKYYFLP